MSMFLPESAGQPPAGGVTSVTPANPQTTQEDIALMQRVLSAAARNPNLIPADFMAYILDYIQTSRLQIPIGQVFGFTQFTAQQDVVGLGSAESTSSATYVDLATVGPSLTGLPDGQYIIIFGCDAHNSATGVGSIMSLSINGVAAVDTDSCQMPDQTKDTSMARAVVKTLSNGGANSVIAKYREGYAAGTATFTHRWLIALKYANR